jgi:RNA recognition motif-containing protein
MQLGDDEEELELGEIPPEEPAAGWNADPAHESLLGKEKTAAGEEEAKTIAREPAAKGSSAHRALVVVVSTGVVVGRDGKASAAEEKRMKEVFVGGLSRDATEEDVKASAAGEITQVRMIMDRMTSKNKGYCFVAYRDAAMASKAIAELSNVKVVLLCLTIAWMNSFRFFLTYLTGCIYTHIG